MAAPRYHDNLWVLIASPTIWAGHFLACYVLAAVYCAKLGRATQLDPVVGIVLVLTVLALAAIGAFVVKGYRQHRTGGRSERPHYEDTELDRHRFVGFALLLLSGLSAVAVIYTGIVVLFFETCQ